MFDSDRRFTTARGKSSYIDHGISSPPCPTLVRAENKKRLVSYDALINSDSKRGRPMNSVTVEEIDEICVITINRPQKRNAVDRPTAELLATAFREFILTSRDAPLYPVGAPLLFYVANTRHASTTWRVRRSGIILLSNVRFTPKSGHEWLWRGMSAFDP